MGMNFKQTRMSEDELAMVSSIVFVQLAQTGSLDDVTITEHPALFPEWNTNWTGKAGTIVMDEGRLFRSIHDVTNIGQNTKPVSTPSMWTPIGDPTEEYPEWIQPLGSHDCYNKGDKVSYDGKKWVSTIDGNVWQPSVYGWEVVS